MGDRFQASDPVRHWRGPRATLLPKVVAWRQRWKQRLIPFAAVVTKGQAAAEFAAKRQALRDILPGRCSSGSSNHVRFWGESGRAVCTAYVRFDPKRTSTALSECQIESIRCPLKGWERG